MRQAGSARAKLQPMQGETQMRRAEVSAVAMDPNHKVPVVLLKPENDDRFIPIWIGMMEASAILVAMEGAETSRPMTHDLMFDVLTQCSVQVDQIEVNDLRDGTYYAEILASHLGEQLRIDCRPSDAIAIALRAEAPIFIHEHVLERVQFVDDPQQASTDEAVEAQAADEEDVLFIPAACGAAPPDEDEMKKMLEDLDPDDFKYRM